MAQRTGPLRRRTVLTGVGAAAAVALAGCTGNGNGNGDDDGDDDGDGEVEIVEHGFDGTFLVGVVENNAGEDYDVVEVVATFEDEDYPGGIANYSDEADGGLEAGESWEFEMFLMDPHVDEEYEIELEYE